jgi:putative endonuclease
MSETLDLNFSAISEKADPRPALGAAGERLAVQFLENNGYRIVLSNFKVPVGRNSKGVQVTGEIDIIALHGETLCFVEVKARRSDEFTPLTSNVDLRKQRQIIRTSKVYRRLFNVYETPHRYDVVTVLMPEGSEPVIEHFKSFWNEASFRKMNWEAPSWREFY